MTYAVFDNILFSKILASFSILVLGFISIMPLMVIIYPKIIKSNRYDSKYMNFCLIAAILRFLFWAINIIGVRDHMILLILNAFGLAIFALIQSNFKRISSEYFKY